LKSLPLSWGQAFFKMVLGICKTHEPPSDPMTRSDLVEELAARFAQLTHRDAELAVKTVLDAMSDALAKGHRIEIRGFGSFSINRRPPRVGRNPRSGESVQIPEKRVPHFKPGKALREAVDAGTASPNGDITQR
jgi:integration host factor subunit beta